jgi:hypothetical protein
MEIPMHARKCCAIVFAVLAVSLLLATPAPALGYVGPGPGLEMIPYFFSLVAWAGMAVGATLAWPVCSLVRRLWSGALGTSPASGDPSR